MEKEKKNLRLRMITSEKKMTDAFSNPSGLKINKNLKQQLQTPHYMTPIKNRVYTKTGTHKIKAKINQSLPKHTSSSPQLTRSATPIPKKTRETINCNLKKNNSFIPATLKNNHHNTKARSLTPIRFPNQTTYGRNSSAMGSNLLKDSTDTSNLNNFQGKKKELQIILSLKRKIKRQNELLEQKDKEIENYTKSKNNARLNELLIENGVFQKELQKMKELIKQKDQANHNNIHDNNNCNNNETSTIEEKVKDDIKTLQINMNDLTEKYQKEIEKNKKLDQNYINLNQDYIRLKNDFGKKLKEIEELKKSNNENKDSDLEYISLDEEKLKAVTEQNKELAIKIEKLNDVINHLNEAHQEAIRENASLKEEKIKIKKCYEISLISPLEIENISLMLPILFNKLKIEKTTIEGVFNDNYDIKEISNELCSIFSINKQDVNYIERYFLHLFQQNNFDLNKLKEFFMELITKELSISETVSENITKNIKQLIQKCESFDLLSTKTIRFCAFKKIFDFVYSELSQNDFVELLNYSISHNSNNNYSLTYIQYEQFYSLDSSLENGNVVDEEIIPRTDTNLIISDVVERKLITEESEIKKEEDNLIDEEKKENTIIKEKEVEKDDKNLLEEKKESKEDSNGNVNEDNKNSPEIETKIIKNTGEFDVKENMSSKEENIEQQNEIKEIIQENEHKEKIIIGDDEEEEKNNEDKKEIVNKEENIEKSQKNESNNNEIIVDESNKEKINSKKQNERDLINEEEKDKKSIQEEKKEETKENNEKKEEDNIEKESINQEEKETENKNNRNKEEPIIQNEINQSQKEDNFIENEEREPLTFEKIINSIMQHLEKNNQTINDFLSPIPENDYCLIENEKYIPIEIFINNFGILEIFNTKKISNQSFDPSILNETKDKINYQLFTSYFILQNDKEIVQECDNKVEENDIEKEKEENNEIYQITKEYVTELFNNVIDMIKEKYNSCDEPQDNTLKEEKNGGESQNIVQENNNNQ